MDHQPIVTQSEAWTPSEDTPQWTAVRISVPMEGEAVLVTDGKEIHIGWRCPFVDGGWDSTFGLPLAFVPTHWMELPSIAPNALNGEPVDDRPAHERFPDQFRPEPGQPGVWRFIGPQRTGEPDAWPGESSEV